jgi:hypothetical protein
LGGGREQPPENDEEHHIDELRRGMAEHVPLHRRRREDPDQQEGRTAIAARY